MSISLVLDCSVPRFARGVRSDAGPSHRPGLAAAEPLVREPSAKMGPVWTAPSHAAHVAATGSFGPAGLPSKACLAVDGKMAGVSRREARPRPERRHFEYPVV